MVRISFQSPPTRRCQGRERARSYTRYPLATLHRCTGVARAGIPHARNTTIPKFVRTSAKSPRSVADTRPGRAPQRLRPTLHIYSGASSPIAPGCQSPKADYADPLSLRMYHRHFCERPSWWDPRRASVLGTSRLWHVTVPGAGDIPPHVVRGRHPHMTPEGSRGRSRILLSPEVGADPSRPCPPARWRVAS